MDLELELDLNLVQVPVDSVKLGKPPPSCSSVKWGSKILTGPPGMTVRIK